MNDFDYDAMQKKRIARSARHQKKGSKSKRCTLPSDYLTESQKRKLNGEIMTYQINKPIAWKEFIKYPVDIQKKYLEYMSHEHGCTVGMLDEMFGKPTNSTCTYIAKYRPELKGILQKRATEKAKDAFREWCSNPMSIEEPPAQNATETVTEAVAEAKRILEKEKPVLMAEPRKALPEMPFVNVMDKGTITATGRAMDIGQALYRMLQDTKIRAVIQFEVDETQNAGV